MRVRASLHLRNEVAIDARERLGFTQKQVADLAGCSVAHVGYVERMQFKKLTPVALVQIATVLAIDDKALVPMSLRDEDLQNAHVKVMDISPARLMKMGAEAAERLEFNADRELGLRLLPEAMDRVIDTLTEQEGEVLRRRWGLGCSPESLREVGVRLGCTQERIRQVELKAIRKCQRPFRLNMLQEAEELV